MYSALLLFGDRCSGVDQLKRSGPICCGWRPQLFLNARSSIAGVMYCAQFEMLFLFGRMFCRSIVSMFDRPTLPPFTSGCDSV